MKRRTTILLLWACLPMSCIGIWFAWPFVLVGSAPRELDEVSMAMWARPSGRAWYLDNLARQPRVMEQGRLLNWCLGVNGARSNGKASTPLAASDLVSMEPGDDLTKLLALAVGRDVDPNHYGDSHVAWALVRVGFWDMAMYEHQQNPQFFLTKKYIGWITRLDEKSRISAVMSFDIDAMTAIKGEVMGDYAISGFLDPYDPIYGLRDSVIKILKDTLVHSPDREATLKQWCVRYRRSVAMHWLALDLILVSNQQNPAYSSGTLTRLRTLTSVAADWDFFEKKVIVQIDEILDNTRGAPRDKGWFQSP